LTNVGESRTSEPGQIPQRQAGRESALPPETWILPCRRARSSMMTKSHD